MSSLSVKCPVDGVRTTNILLVPTGGKDILHCIGNRRGCNNHHWQMELLQGGAVKAYDPAWEKTGHPKPEVRIRTLSWWRRFWYWLTK